MVDEIFSNCEIPQQHNLINVNSYIDTDMDDLDVNGMSEIINRSSYDTSTSSPESTSENAFSFNDSKFISTEEKSNDKKVHWNPSQVLSLLDCIEKRICDFRKKSVEKSVWLSIGKEMLEHGNFSVEHCYNKWKNLRRDVRLFNNSSTTQKLSIRNAYIMERVQKLVLDIGYENSSRKSSSPISPNNDMSDPKEPLKEFYLNNGNKKESWIPYSEIKTEQYMNPMTKFDYEENDSCQTPSNPANFVSLEDSIISLLSDPSVSHTILMNPKLLEEILPGLDIAALLKKFVDSHPESVPMQEKHNHSKVNNIYTQHVVNNIHPMPNSTQKPAVGNNNDRQSFINSAQPTAIDVGNSWPHQLYELLHSFRDEESRQMQRLDQIVNYVQIMQESTKRRLSTINQLISLAGMLIPQR